VLDSPLSLVLEQAEARLHQKATLLRGAPWRDLLLRIKRAHPYLRQAASR
jgi:hypothetical protein